MKQTAVKIFSSLIIFSFLFSYAEMYIPVGLCSKYDAIGRKCPDCNENNCCCANGISSASDPVCSSNSFQKKMTASRSMCSFRQLNCNPNTNFPTLAFNKDVSHSLIIAETVRSVSSIEYSDHYKSFIPEEIQFPVFHPPTV